MNKLFAIIDLFRKGSAVANPGAYKDTANFGLLIGALIMSVLTLLKVCFDVNIPMDLTEANSIGAGFGCLIAWVINNISSKNAGVLPAKREHPIAVPEEPPRFNDVNFDHHPKACPDCGLEDEPGLSNGTCGVPPGHEAGLQEALKNLRNRQRHVGRDEPN